MARCPYYTAYVARRATRQSAASGGADGRQNQGCGRAVFARNLNFASGLADSFNFRA